MIRRRFYTPAMLERDAAWALLSEWTETESLRRHARAVELVMRAAALYVSAPPGRGPAPRYPALDLGRRVPLGHPSEAP